MGSELQTLKILEMYTPQANILFKTQAQRIAMKDMTGFEKE